MNLWLRLLVLILGTPLRTRLSGPLAVSRLSFRVWPHDLDTSAHLNNGRYWTLMDLGRFDLILRTGLWRAVLRHRWVPVVSAAAIRFRRELRAFERFGLDTRLMAWTETHLVIEHRVSRADGSVAAIALLKTALYDRRGRAFVPAATLLAAIGSTAVSPELPPEAAALLATDEALRRTTVPA